VVVQRLPRRPLRRVPGRPLPAGGRRARRRMLHPGRVEPRAPAALVILSQLEVVALGCIPTATCPIPDQESSQVRRAQSARSYEGVADPAKPTAATRSLPRGSIMVAARPRCSPLCTNKQVDRASKRHDDLEP
jgi:hypothetical protein